MPEHHIRYDLLAQQALRGVVRTVLADVAKKGLPGEHHFKITFNTTAPGVRLSDRLRAQYPETMTIILQHQFWDLTMADRTFEVGLSFGGITERVGVPYRQPMNRQRRRPGPMAAAAAVKWCGSIDSERNEVMFPGRDAAKARSRANGAAPHPGNAIRFV